MHLLALGLISVAPSLACATAPQSPIAAGPVDGVLEVIRQARACGYKALRIELESDASASEQARLFLDDAPTEAATRCLDSWTTSNGARLRLSPRWYGDKFEGDPPKSR
ncbi:hypothetical protein [Caulobacter endophyticus]|uniref:hypothetical protein n=1 Tax=Caulobacter endophyticus TaxID=2172652 RepID=UPI00240F9911|nr:hypothetical protein [Caulobacter endophyticus]